MNSSSAAPVKAGVPAAADRAGRPGAGAPAGAEGPILFARYAYPPNELGYCGPNDHGALLQYGAARVVDPGLTRLARGFAGAWPYLELIAGAAGIGDPLDVRVVEAYWLGNPLLGLIDARDLGSSLDQRFRRRAGRSWTHLAEAIGVGAAPSHCFHVFGVYPWLGLLRSGMPADEPLEVLQRCRIRWGKVIATAGDQVTVVSRPITFDGRHVGLGAYREEVATRALAGVGFVDALRPGEWVSLHWGWVCDRLSRRQLTNLRRYTLLQLDVTNRRVVHPGPAMAFS